MNIRVLSAALVRGSRVAAVALLTGPFSAFAQQPGNVLDVPRGYSVQKIAAGLNYPTTVAWDDSGRMYVLEAGAAGLETPEIDPARILRVEEGRTVEVVRFSPEQVGEPVVGLAWHDGSFYITHRHPRDRTGTVSRVSMQGTVTHVITGIADSQSEHFLNDIRKGPDGRIYFASGPAGNSSVMGLDNAPFIKKSPGVKGIPCRDYVLTGRNFITPDFRTDDPSDTVMTGAFVPFGTPTSPGQRIPGQTKCGGSILSFNPASPESSLSVYAHGFRQLIGIAWDSAGQMFGAENGLDIRGSRPVKDDVDVTFRIVQNTWYGHPDFSRGLEPLTDPKFMPPSSHGAPRVRGDEFLGKKLGFLVDHAASGLSAPPKSLIAARHEWNSSPALLDFAPSSWGEMAGQLFVAEWGDLAPATNPLKEGKSGSIISRVDTKSGLAVPFLRNMKPGPAAEQQAPGRGLEHPFSVRFGPDGAMYIVDYGIMRINPAKDGAPYEFPQNTGAIWKVTQGTFLNRLIRR
ncbi:MAG TPA: sugar dehydrogenase [Thermoanaerobaculia bacterium]|nr:sugar dehydrogenase [Thermoanaerobaculia bacterium]